MCCHVCGETGPASLSSVYEPPRSEFVDLNGDVFYRVVGGSLSYRLCSSERSHTVALIRMPPGCLLLWGSQTGPTGRRRGPGMLWDSPSGGRTEGCLENQRTVAPPR